MRLAAGVMLAASLTRCGGDTLPVNDATVLRLDTTSMDHRLAGHLPLALQAKVWQGPQPRKAEDAAAALLAPAGGTVDGPDAYVLAAGPQLDSPDEAAVRSLIVEGRTLRLLVEHTHARGQGEALRRNLPWQPLVVIPLPGGLAAGDWKAILTWRVIAKPDAVKSLGSRPETVTSFQFRVLPRRIR